jgi:hypothetical protein
VSGRLRRLRIRLTGTPDPDPGKVGISFVDVLFALVVGEVLSPLRRWWTIPGPGWSHLVLAAVLVLTSWIGYHNSTNRPKYEIAFVNLPLWQFVLDISMVIAYWFTATSAELPEHSPVMDLPAPRGSAVPEAILVAVCFLLYVLWDEVGRQIKKSSLYGASSLSLATSMGPPRRQWHGTGSGVFSVGGSILAVARASGQGSGELRSSTATGSSQWGQGPPKPIRLQNRPQSAQRCSPR